MFGKENFFIAEIGNNHMGEISKAKDMIIAAKNSGASAVKFQKRDNENLFTPSMKNMPYTGNNSFGEKYIEHRKFLELSEQDFAELKEFSNEIGITFFATPFDLKSLSFLKELDCPLYKIASADICFPQLIEAVCATGKPVILSTGAATRLEIQQAVKLVESFGNEYALLQCTSSYPCNVEDLNLGALKELKEIAKKGTVGVSDHQSGIAMPIVAWMLGARVFEKHFTLHRSWKGTDQSFSLEPGGFARMVRDVNNIELAIGNDYKQILPKEEAPINKMRKAIVASRDLKKGHILAADDLDFRCPAGELSPKDEALVIGKALKTDIQQFTPLKLADIS